MFTKICIDNVYGIYNPICLEFISKSRKKDETNAIAKTRDNIYINKLNGIIGGNASRKN
jgi:hypothetical protein